MNTTIIFETKEDIDLLDKVLEQLRFDGYQWAGGSEIEHSESFLRLKSSFDKHPEDTVVLQLLLDVYYPRKVVLERFAEIADFNGSSDIKISAKSFLNNSFEMQDFKVEVEEVVSESVKGEVHFHTYVFGTNRDSYFEDFLASYDSYTEAVVSVCEKIKTVKL